MTAMIIVIIIIYHELICNFQNRPNEYKHTGTNGNIFTINMNGSFDL